MTANHKTPVQIASAKRQARWLRRGAAVLLLLGILGADLVYWLGTRAVDSSNPLPVAGEDKAVTRQEEVLFGKQPILLEQLGRNLKRPGTQACLIVAMAVLAAGGCFYFACLLEDAGKDQDENTIA